MLRREPVKVCPGWVEKRRYSPGQLAWFGFLGLEVASTVAFGFASHHYHSETSAAHDRMSQAVSDYRKIANQSVASSGDASPIEAAVAVVQYGKQTLDQGTTGANYAALAEIAGGVTAASVIFAAPSGAFRRRLEIVPQPGVQTDSSHSAGIVPEITPDGQPKTPASYIAYLQNAAFSGLPPESK